MSTVRMAGKLRKFIDIGVNLTDGMYAGIYHGSSKHPADLPAVIERARVAGVERLIITGTCLKDSKEALAMASHNEHMYSTVGCHPTRCGEFTAEGTDPEQYLSELLDIIQQQQQQQHKNGANPHADQDTARGGTERREAVVVAVGEIGLDYARLNFCDAGTQRTYFEKQLSLAAVTGLPVFLHCRDAADDLLRLLAPWRERISGGVVHSFDGTKDEMTRILDMDLYIGINGCSLRSAENLSVAAQIPLSRLMLETDSPWCEVKPTHAGYTHVCTHRTTHTKKKEKWQEGCLVKGRNEPCNIVQVAEVLAGARGDDMDVIVAAAYENTIKLFFHGEAPRG